MIFVNLRESGKRAFTFTARLLLSLIALLIQGLFVSAVEAQAEPILSISPNPLSFYLNGPAAQLSVDLMAQNVEDMNVYEFVMSYDPNVLEFVKVTPGSWLSPGSKFYSSYTPGRIHYAYAKLGGTPVSGNGTLATIVFKAIGYGNTDLIFSEPVSCKYSRPDGSQHPFNLQNGLVNATFDPLITANSTVVGTFSLQGQTANGGVPVALDDGEFLDDGPFSGESFNQSGTNLSISPVVMDMYTITTAQPRYLNIDATCGKTKAVFGVLTTLAPLKLFAGNAIWTDNDINALDLALVAGSYGNISADLEPGEEFAADLNFDGLVDVRDLALVAGNYGLSAALAYADWLP